MKSFEDQDAIFSEECRRMIAKQRGEATSRDDMKLSSQYLNRLETQDDWKSEDPEKEIADILKGKELSAECSYKFIYERFSKFISAFRHIETSLPSLNSIRDDVGEIHNLQQPNINSLLAGVYQSENKEQA